MIETNSPFNVTLWTQLKQLPSFAAARTLPQDPRTVEDETDGELNTWALTPDAVIPDPINKEPSTEISDPNRHADAPDVPEPILVNDLMDRELPSKEQPEADNDDESRIPDLADKF